VRSAGQLLVSPYHSRTASPHRSAPITATALLLTTIFIRNKVPLIPFTPRNPLKPFAGDHHKQVCEIDRLSLPLDQSLIARAANSSQGQTGGRLCILHSDLTESLSRLRHIFHQRRLSSLYHLFYAYVDFGLDFGKNFLIKSGLLLMKYISFGYITSVESTSWGILGNTLFSSGPVEFWTSANGLGNRKSTSQNSKNSCLIILNEVY